jgi:hypothetical protein
MRRAMNCEFRLDRTLMLGLIAGCFCVSATYATADSAFIQQASGGATTTNTSAPEAIPGSFVPSGGRAGTLFLPTPEQAVPGRSQSRNIVQSVTVGSFNSVVQLQGGQNDLSSASILGGSHDDLGVFQGGNNQLSNIVSLGMRGADVAVLQPPGSAPVNMLIARLPNGAILIKR